MQLSHAQHALRSRPQGTGPTRGRPVAAVPALRRSTRLQATRDVEFAYQDDIQLKLKPEVFAERQENRFEKLGAAQDWKAVCGMFEELGPDAERSPALVVEMLVALQRLLPQHLQQQQRQALTQAQRRPQQQLDDAAVLAAAIARMSQLLLGNVTKLKPRTFTSAVWALALLPDPAAALPGAAAAAVAARARVVGGLGAYAISKLRAMTAEEVFHLLAGLNLLGFVPPQALSPSVRAPPPPASSKEGPGGQAAPAAGVGRGAPRSFAALIEGRSAKVLPFLTPKGVADAAFVVARMVAPGAMSQQWLVDYAKVCKQCLPDMEPEALVHAGYALARHGLRPSNSWHKTYLAALQEAAKTLNGEEFPMVLFTLARWQQLEAASAGAQAQQDGGGGGGLDAAAAAADGYPGDDDEYGSDSSSSGSDDGPTPATQPPQSLIDELLLASHTNRALRELPLGQVVVMLRALGQLQSLVGTTINSLWLKRVWPAVEAKVDAAAGSSSSSSSSSAGASSLAADLAGLLGVLGQLQLADPLPDDFLGGVVGTWGQGLDALSPEQLATGWRGVVALQQTPDAITKQQLSAAALAAVPRADIPQLPLLLEVALGAASSDSSSSSSSSSSVEEVLEAVVTQLQAKITAAAARVASTSSSKGTAPAAAGKRAAQLQEQQLAARVAAVAAATQQGLWDAPGAVLQVLRLTAAAPQAAASVPRLQQLWEGAVLQVAAVMPTDKLVRLMMAVADDLAPSDVALLGISMAGTGAGAASASASRAQQQHDGGAAVMRSQADVIHGILRVSVSAGLAADADAGAARSRSKGAARSRSKGAARAAAAAAAARVCDPAASFLHSFSVNDAAVTLGILADLGATVATQRPLLAACVSLLSGAMAQPEPTHGLTAFPEDAQELLDVMTDMGLKVPARVLSRHAAWASEDTAQQLAAGAPALDGGSGLEAAWEAVQQPQADWSDGGFGGGWS